MHDEEPVTAGRAFGRSADALRRLEASALVPNSATRRRPSSQHLTESVGPPPCSTQFASASPQASSKPIRSSPVSQFETDSRRAAARVLLLRRSREGAR